MIQRLIRPPIGIALSLLALIALGATLLAVRDRSGTKVVGEAPTATVPDTQSPVLGANAEPRAGIRVDGRRRQLIGVRTTRVVQDSLVKTIGAVGVVRSGESRLMDINLKMDGWVRDVHVSYVGQPVRAGQPLITVFSPELYTLQTNLLGAIRARDQTPVLRLTDGSEQTDRLIDTPRLRLKQLDVADEELETLERERRASGAVVFRSPINGVVLETTVVKGMHAEAGQMLYRIADLSVVVVEADFRETDAPQLKPGAHTEITLDALPGERFVGRIVSTHPYVSEQTRTVKARIELPNKGGKLKPGMYANVELRAPAPKGLVVPADAVVDSGSRQIVFVTDGGGYFEPRSVTVGARADGQVLIVEGLRENEEVATRGTFFLDSESQIRAALQDYEAPSSSGAATASGEDVELAWQVTPDPPRLGDNMLQVQVKNREGRPVVDADINVRLYMPPMPSMNMPAMASDARLTHVKDGLYRGSASVSMAGRWELTITARLQDRLIARRQAALLVR